MTHQFRIFLLITVVCFLTYGCFDTATTVLVIENAGQKSAQLAELNLNVALFAVEHGYRVVPIGPGNTPYYGKGLLEHGWQDATTDPGLIRQWWQQWPGAAIGITDGLHQRGVLRYDLTLFESSGILSWAFELFGIYGIVALKLLITGMIIGAVALVLCSYPRIGWVGISLLGGFSVVGAIAGYSNLDYFSFAIGLESIGLDYGMLYAIILIASVVVGVVLAILDNVVRRRGTVAVVEQVDPDFSYYEDWVDLEDL
jgi:hypothetical protein